MKIFEYKVEFTAYSLVSFGHKSYKIIKEKTYFPQNYSALALKRPIFKD